MDHNTVISKAECIRCGKYLSPGSAFDSHCDKCAEWTVVDYKASVWGGGNSHNRVIVLPHVRPDEPMRRRQEATNA